MDKKLTDKSADELVWTDLGNHAYHHWLHTRGYSEQFDLLCEKICSTVIDQLSEEDKNDIIKNKIYSDLRDHHHYGHVANYAETMGQQSVVEEVGLKPSDFTGCKSKFKSWKIDLETGTWEPPTPNPSDGKMYHWDDDTQEWVEECDFKPISRTISDIGGGFRINNNGKQ